MTLTAGVKLGPYEIVAPLGAGGMGEVYRARDHRLGREVALKVLSDAVRSPDRLERFAREARAAAAVRHQNILAVYDVGTGDEPFIVSELLEGETLRDAITPGAPWPVGKVVAVARQIADGLAAAHAQGITHRDLKPENIFIDNDGVVKILDFGLARLAEGVTTPADDPTRVLTEEGTVLGTMGYMAPEQVRGQPADHRSDVFAFGAVLYELLTTKRAFAGESAADTMTAILTKEPADLPQLASTVSPSLARIITRCLEKRADARFQSASDLAFALKTLEEPAVDVQLRAARWVVGRRQLLWLGGSAVASAAAAVAAWRLWPHAAGVRSLAVLPFNNSDNDDDSDFLCDGLTETVIQRLSALPSLNVMARSTVFNFKGKSTDPREAGRKLGVDVILTGSVVRRQGRLIVSVELADVRTGLRLWGNRFEHAAADVLSIEDELAGEIVEQGFRLNLTGQERHALASHPTENPEAYEAYLRGVYLLRRDTQQDYLNARELFQRAIERDPRFALAYLGVCTSHGLSAILGFERPADAWPAAETYIRRALGIDSTIAEAHQYLSSQAFFFRWNWVDADRELREAQRLKGKEQNPDFLRELALQRWALGRLDEAIAVARRAREVDPVSPEFTLWLADYLLHAQRLDEAAALYEKVIRDDPTDARAYFGLAELRRVQGRFDDALDARRRAHGAIGDDSLVEAFRNAHGEAAYRRMEEAAVRQELESLKSRAIDAYVSPLDFGRAYAQLGETEQAFSYFEPAFAERASGLVFLNVDRAWDRIRDDPRFPPFVHRVGLS